ncbi:hypothetical protein BVC93_22015 [Mycobacterium sp. MS1601]|nr:hypothetical protein BVC93_22015 [Mycobacterium sp. MS1601]
MLVRQCNLLIFKRATPIRLCIVTNGRRINALEATINKTGCRTPVSPYPGLSDLPTGTPECALALGRMRDGIHTHCATGPQPC